MRLSFREDVDLRLQYIFGGLVFIISFIAYTASVAPTTSFWDCGEFIACSRILGVMHPPGSPLFLLIGRIMTMLPIAGDIGLRVNMFSVFISAATMLLTFMIIIQLIRRWRGDAKNFEDRFIMYGSALFGALALAFSDSVWFNAVEAEVYAFSLFFTALVVWLALRWGEYSRKASSLLLILFIFYLFGLAFGVHLLNILAFPFVLLIAYFHDNERVRKLLLLLTIQAAVPLVLYVLFYQYNPATMSYSDLLAHQDKAGSFMKIFGSIWVAATLVYTYIKDRDVFIVWWIIPLLVIIGYSTYTLIYVRANLAPPINENDPSTFERMMNYLERKQYGEEDLLLTFLYRKAEFWSYQINKMYVRYFGWQFIGKGIMLDNHDRIIKIISFRGLYGVPFLIGLWGVIHHFYRDWKRAVAVAVLFILTGLAIIIYLNQPDPQPRERDYSYVGSFFAFALWIGIGFAGILEWIAEYIKDNLKLKKIVYVAVALILFIAVPVNMYAFNRTSHSRAGNYVAYDYSHNILESCEPNAIVFTNGDNDTFPLWFLQEVYGIRKDVRVVNLSLLNTHWYIKQLRDEEPKIPIGLSDEIIHTLYAMPWKTQKVEIPVPEDVVGNLKRDLKPEIAETVSSDFTFTLKPTFNTGGGKGIRVQDLMILRILQSVQWRRPVYFAMTVSSQNKIGLDRNLRLDGLTFKVVPYKVQEIEAEKLEANLLNKFLYRGLDDHSVYYNTNIQNLLQNYRSSFLELVRHHLERGDKEKAAELLTKMSEIIPDTHVPYSDRRQALIISDMYSRAGMDPLFEERSKRIIEGHVPSIQEQTWLAGYYSQVLQEWDMAEELYRQIIEYDPNSAEAFAGLFQVYKASGQTAKAAGLLEDWLMRHPNDRGARTELENLKKNAQTDTVKTASVK